MRQSCVVIGALCEDIVKAHGGSRRGLGGTSYYFSAAFTALGGQVGCVAKASQDWMLEELNKAGVRTDGVGKGSSCCFELSYQGPERSLTLRRHSSKITAGDVPAEMMGYDGVHVGPVEMELDDSLWEWLKGKFSYTSLDVQGLTRTFDGRTGKVGAIRGLSRRIARALTVAQVVKFSRDEARAILGTESRWDQAAARLKDEGVGTVLITLGPRGALVLEGGKVHEIPPFPSQPLDWTGAGDCFMAGFAHHRLSGHGSIDAAKFGSALAAIAIERPRPLKFPNVSEVVQKMTASIRL